MFLKKKICKYKSRSIRRILDTFRTSRKYPMNIQNNRWLLLLPDILPSGAD